MQIRTNLSSLSARNSLSKSASALSDSITRLSSGLRINAASDDAAGQAIANRMASLIRGKERAHQNAKDAQSLIQTVEGSLDAINDILLRLRDLALQRRSGTLTAEDRGSIDTEVNQLKQEINRIGATAAFNGIDLADAAKSLHLQVSETDQDNLQLDLRQLDTKNLYLEDFEPPLGPALSQITIESGAHAGTWNVEFSRTMMPHPTDPDRYVVLGKAATAAYYGVAEDEITYHQMLNLDGTPTGKYVLKVGTRYFSRPPGVLDFRRPPGFE